MLSDCVGERLTLGVFLRYVSCRLIIVFSFCCRVLLWRVLTEKCSLGEFYSLLVVEWFVTAKRVSYGKDYGGGFCGGTRSEVWLRKIQTHEGVRSNQFTRLGFIKCFNVSVKVAAKRLLTERGYSKYTILWNQKLWCDTLFLHKYKTKRRILWFKA